MRRELRRTEGKAVPDIAALLNVSGTTFYRTMTESSDKRGRPLCSWGEMRIAQTQPKRTSTRKRWSL